MASINETGHAKNIATFEDLISFCTAHGAMYNPSQASIKLTALTELLTAAQAALQALKAAKATYDNATNAREISFKSLRPLATKVINALAATGAAQQTIDDARTLVNKIQGKRAKAIEVPDEKAIAAGALPVRTASASQQGFDSLIDHFAKFISLLSIEPKYQPNEDEFKVAALNTMLADLKAKNTDVINAYTEVSNARIARNIILYNDLTGLVDISLAVKAYLKSLFGPTTQQFKQVSALKFNRIAFG